MENLKDTDRLAFYVYPDHESRIFAAHALGAAGFKTILSTYRPNLLEEISHLAHLDVIVFDRVREMEHLNYCRQLKNDERTKNIPLIVIVANPEITQDQVISSGADNYLPSPLNLDLFQEIISAYLNH